MGKRFITVIIIIALVAFAIRLSVCRELCVNDPQVAMPSNVTDMATYMDCARKIMSGEYSGEFYYQPFYYAVFLPLAHLMFGKSIWAVLIMQSLAGALTVYIAAIISARIWGRVAGIATALLMTFSAAHIFYTPYMLLEVLQGFWIILLLYELMNAVKYKKWIYWVLCGLIAGMAILTRGNAWFFVPLLIAAAFYSVRRRPGFPAKILPVIILIVFILLPQLPFIIHNTKVLGKLSGPSTASAAVLALGNTPEAPPGGRNPGLGPGPMEYPLSYHIWMKKKDEISIPSQILKWFREEPLAFIELTFRKMLLFWDYREIPNNIAFESNALKSPLLGILGFIPSSVIISLAIAGMLFFLKAAIKKFNIFILFYFVIAFWLAVSAFYILARFRVPGIPLLSVFAGGFSGYIVYYLRKRGFEKFLRKSLPPLFFGVMICFSFYEIYRTCFEAPLMRLARPNGVSVEISPTEKMILDNGPFTFGGWTLYKAPEGAVIEKKFSDVANGNYKNAKLSLSLFWENPGTAEFIINGEKKSVKSDKTGMMEHEFDIPFPKDLNVRIQTLSMKNASFGFDTQRDYRRTLVNGEDIGAELICRIFCFK
ncbi:MAG: hypothetical protein A2017_14310 [Lentisphaerae bacterium GWF2_44_16]|nr:MAG: hypothetical protein A2017_14310 [Lentisphaerae bacterium GWF2_44_16]